MSLKRMFLVAQKTIREIIRSLTLLFFLLGLPVFFMAITYIGYGHTPKTATYRVLLLSNTDKAQELIKLLQETSYADGRPCFQVDPVTDRAEAESRLKKKQAA